MTDVRRRRKVKKETDEKKLTIRKRKSLTSSREVNIASRAISVNYINNYVETYVHVNSIKNPRHRSSVIRINRVSLLTRLVTAWRGELSTRMRLQNECKSWSVYEEGREEGRG